MTEEEGKKNNDTICAFSQLEFVDYTIIVEIHLTWPSSSHSIVP